MGAILRRNAPHVKPRRPKEARGIEVAWPAFRRAGRDAPRVTPATSRHLIDPPSGIVLAEPLTLRPRGGMPAIVERC
jgi:hypothetical protein